VYIFVRRNVPYPLLEVFDLPDTHESCARRNQTTSPIQALTLLNSALSLEWAEHFANRVLETAGSDPEAQIGAAYRLAFARLPTPGERELVRSFFERQQEIVRLRAYTDGQLAVPSSLPPHVDPGQAAALVDFCHMLLNANEFVCLN
jgi:hypothetical protein